MAKNENKIYDYFKCEDFVFNGKYARYADAMLSLIHILLL